MLKLVRKLDLSRAIMRLIGMVLAIAMVMIAYPASAQTVTQYTNSTDTASGGLNETAFSCANPLTRTFFVGGTFIVSDVDIGVLAAHTYRGDLVMTLEAPDSTLVTLTSGSGSIGANNFNVLFDDAAGSSITGHTTADTASSTTIVPTYQRTFSPVSPLSAFNGVSANGTWTLRICDQFNQDSGTFYQTDLFLTSSPANFADLSLTKSVDDTTPANAQTITYTLTVQNNVASNQTASGIIVTDQLPAGVSFVSSSDPANYNSGTGIWNVGTLAPGASATLTIDATVTATSGATIANEAEITNSSRVDIDSTPNNGATGEDDYDSASFTVSGTRVAGIPPVLSCPNGSVLFDWDPLSWTAGSVNNTYALGTLGNINFDLDLPSGGAWLNSASLGGQSPNLQTSMSGGLSPAQESLVQLVNLANENDVVTTTITLPTPMDGAQFTVFDVDFGNNQFADRLTVTGRLEGATVMPTLTNGTSNYVIGNSAYGDVATNNALANANVVVTFQSPIDTIIIEYGNHSIAPTNPGQQAISIHDIRFCRLVTTLSVTKISSVLSDPVNGATNPKAIPGALIEYIFSVTNPNPISVQDVVLTDVPPGDIKMCVADIGGAGPVVFTNGSPSSGLTYNYTALGNGSDDLEFSNDGGATWTYTPTADADGCDGDITSFRAIPGGAFNASGTFTMRTRFILE